jgi:hypothetical protein
MNDRLPITVWRFRDAPQELRALSDHGGDEDWLAEVPPRFRGDYIGWMEDGTSFGCCSVSLHSHPTKPGWTVRIGAHA